MNQILATSNNENNKKENHKEDREDRIREIDFSNDFSQSTKSPIDTKKIVVFFAIAIAILGIILIGIYGYKTIKEKSDTKTKKPQVLAEQNDKSITISAKSEVGIDKIIYYWDETDKNELQVNGKTSYERIIEAPIGENILVVQVIDKNGQISEITQELAIEGDQQKPTIEIEVIEEEGIKKVKIVAEDETAMQYLTYRWNSEEETKVEVEDEGDTLIETKLEIQRGENSLTITAVDSSDNIATEEKPFKSGNVPVFDIGVMGDKLIMKITHDIGFKKVEFSLNDKIYTYDENFSGYDPTQTTLEYTFTLKEGKNTVAIIATSMEDTEKTYVGQTTYTPE